jgi:hypothetical protein
MKTSKILLAVVLGSSGALLGAGLSTTDARAQSSTTGAIQGRVTDTSSGAALAGVTIVVSGNSSQTTITEEDGSYRITDLTPGEYLVTFFFGDVTIERRGIKVGVNKTIPLFQKINTSAAVSETIVIDDKPPAIDPTSTTQGITIDQDYTKNIPVPGRTFESTLGAAAGSQSDGVGVSFSGSSSLENQYVVDGVNTTGLKYGTVGSPVINDFIEEIEVITGGYNAEYGRATGGVVNVATLTGGNEFEGKVFAYITPGQLTSARERSPSESISIDATGNEDIDANVGFTLTGPIIKDRVWFAVGAAPRYVQNTITRTTKRRRDCQIQLPTGQLSPCDPESMYGDGDADIDPATGFHIYEDLDSSKLRPNASALSTLAKINFAVKPEHQGQLSFQMSPGHSNNYAIYGLRTTGDYQSDSMGLDAGLKWTSKFDDSKSEVEVVLGWHRDQLLRVTPTPSRRPDVPYEVLLPRHPGHLGQHRRPQRQPRRERADPRRLSRRAAAGPGPAAPRSLPGHPQLPGRRRRRLPRRWLRQHPRQHRGSLLGQARGDPPPEAVRQPRDQGRRRHRGQPLRRAARLHRRRVLRELPEHGVILANRLVQIAPSDHHRPEVRRDAATTAASPPASGVPCRYIERDR